MSEFFKPQSPLNKDGVYFYPLTTEDQVIMDDGSRLSSTLEDIKDKVDNIDFSNLDLEGVAYVGETLDSAVAPINADTLGGKPASEYVLHSEIGGAAGSGAGKAGEAEGAEIFNCYEDAEYEETYNDRVYTWTVHANSASGKYSHAEGASSLASGRTSHAEGESTVAAGMAAHAEGVGTFATGDAAHAEGSWTEASGLYSHAEGSQTHASGWTSHAEGGYTIASERGSHAEGQETEASGLASHAEGQFTKAAGDYSHAEGEYTVASSYAQHAQGSCNIEDASQEYLHIVGNGTPGYQTPSNAHTLDWIGNAVFAGTVSAPGADYAEHFEWLDGNPDNEDRVGMIVTLEGDKIRPATAEDEILGVVSGTAMVIGDNAEWEWQGKFLTDDYGRVITEKVEEFVEIKDPKTGEVIDKKSVGFIKRRKLNPEWDVTKEYTRRSDRPEWDVVGLFGKLHVNDDGTCVPNGWATVGEDGKATASATKTNMRVMKRITDNIILVFMK